MELLDACTQFIAVDSSPSAGSREVVQVAAKLCKEAGLMVQVFEEVHQGIEQANLVAHYPCSSHDNGLMLQAHFDTVEPDHFSLWTKTGASPFRATVHGEQLFGLGAADAKIDFLCKLKALMSFQNQKLEKPIWLVGTFGEETGMWGATRLMRKRVISPRYALVGEATGMQPIAAGKGFAVIDVTIPFSASEKNFRQEHDGLETSVSQSRIFKGRASHSASRESDENAIVGMLDAIEHLPSGTALLEMTGGLYHNSVPERAFLEIDMAPFLEDPILEKIKALNALLKALQTEFKKHEDLNFNPPFATFNLGQVATHEDGIQFTGSVRIPPGVSERIYQAWLDQIQSVCEKIGAHFKIVDFKRPFVTSPQSPLLRATYESMQGLGLAEKNSKGSFTNEANVFSRFGIECVAFGPGVLEDNLHTPYEHVALEKLEQATEIYRKIIQRMCL